MRLHAKVGLALPVILVLTCFVAAQQPAKKAVEPEDQQVVDSKATPQIPAASVKFRSELDLPFGSLNTLGSRIDKARRSHDPVSLAHAAAELAVAEKVSGKKASLTASAVVKEAAKLAALRRQSAEMKAVAAVAEQIGGEEQLIASLKGGLAAADAAVKADSEAAKQTPPASPTGGIVVIHNRTNQHLTIWLNGMLQNEMTPFTSQKLLIPHPERATVLTAYGNSDAESWGPRYIFGKFKTYTWNIND